MRRLACVLLWLSSCVSYADDLVIFSAEWCSPCQQLHKALEADPSLVEGYTVVYVDIQKQPDVARRHNVKTVPTLIATANGRQRRKTGFTSADDLRRWLHPRKTSR